MHTTFTVFGTGSASPQLDRHPSAYLFTVDNEYILLDCGEATQYRLMEARLKMNKLRHILITHLHGDHYFGLIALISSFNLNNRSEPLTIIGPPGLLEILSLQLSYSGTTLRYPLTFVETNPATAKQVYEHPLFTVATVPLMHRVPCNGYIIRTHPTPRKVLREALPANFPVAFVQQLKNGQDVTDPLTGQTYRAAEYTTEGQPAKSLAYCTDTAYLESIVPHIKGVDLLFHEATFQETEAARAQHTFHSTARQAAAIAKQAGVKQLVIGHYSSRYKEVDTHLREAREVFQNTHLANEGLTFTL